MAKNFLNFFLVLVFFSVFFSTSSFSYLIQTPTNHPDFPTQYGYIVNSENLNVNLIMKSFGTTLMFNSSSVTTISGEVYRKDFGEELLSNQELNLDFSLLNFENSSGSKFAKKDFENSKIDKNISAIYLEFFITKIDGSIYEGENIPQKIVIQNLPGKPVLENNLISFFKGESISSLKFKNSILNKSTSIVSYEIKNKANNEIVDSYEANSNFFNFEDIITSIPLDFLSNYSTGVHEFEIKMENLAGTQNVQDFRVVIQGKRLSLGLITSKFDPTLAYFHSIDFPELFGNNIYTSQKDFTFKINTTKEAKCYFTTSVAQSKSNDELLFSEESSTLMSTQDGIVHKLDISPFVGNSVEKYFWVGCVDKYLGVEKVDLHSKIRTNQNYNLKFIFHNKEFNLNLIYPSGLVTSNNVITMIETSTAARCYANLSGNEQKLDSSQNYTSHRKDFTLEDGNYNAKFKCFNVLNKEINKSLNLEVNSQKGLKIVVDENSLYSGTSSQVVKFTTSDVAKSCRYSKELKSVDDFDSFNLIGKSSSNFNFTASALSVGSNEFYIFCKTNSDLIDSPTKINVIYDQTGPKISNLKFVNGKFKSEKYIGNLKSLEVEFDVESLIPVDYFKVVLKRSNSSDFYENNFTVSKNDEKYTYLLKVNKNLEIYSSVEITPYNKVSKSGNTLKKVFVQDVTAPEVALIPSGKFWKITCIDPETQCSKIMFGFSDSILSCLASRNYEVNDSIDAQTNAVICARAINGADLISDVRSQMTGYTGESVKGDNNKSTSGGNPFEDDNLNDNVNSDDLINETQLDDQMDDIQKDSNDKPPKTPSSVPPVYSNDSNSGNLYVVLGAVALVLLLSGGGGYYAYKKGYLNEQLRKLGVKLPNQSGISGSGVYGNSNLDQNQSSSSFGSKSSNIPSLVGGSSKKSKYDEHLNKLNKFLDENIDKKSQVFDSFKNSQKGRVDKYEDTLAKKRGVNLLDSSKEDAKNYSDFDDFYKASKNNSLSGSTTIEDEAEKFEEYYKKKVDSKDTKKETKTEPGKKK